VHLHPKNQQSPARVNSFSSNLKTWLLTLGFAVVSGWVFIETRGREQSEQLTKRIETKKDGQRAEGLTLPGRFQIVRVHDGDTSEMLGSDGIRFTVRFAGIDAPELAQEFGHEARQMLVDLIENHSVTLGEVGRDKYGRYLAQVYCDGVSVNKEMLVRGGAWSYLAGIHYEEFKKFEEEAREKHVGLWAGKHPKPPWEARK
jgi:endonuclease YncB( thermonuclease family)